MTAAAQLVVDPFPQDGGKRESMSRGDQTFRFEFCPDGSPAAQRILNKFFGPAWLGSKGPQSHRPQHLSHDE